MLDHQQRAAGERPDDYATNRERTRYWIERCYDILDVAREKQGLSPYPRPDRSGRTNAARQSAMDYHFGATHSARTEGEQ